MSIRYRFLLVLGIFTSLVFISGFIFENGLFRRNVKKIREEVTYYQNQKFEEKRKEIEEFIAYSMAKKLAQINVLLETIVKFPSLSEWFAPNNENLQVGTWAQGATLLQNEDWIQFLQNTSNSQILSLIVPSGGPFFEMESTPFEEGLAWISVQGSAAYPTPCLGIQLPMRSVQESAEELDALLTAGIIPTVYVFYSLDRLKQLDFSLESLLPIELSVPFMQGYELDEEKFLSFLKRAVELSQDPFLKQPASQETAEALVSSSQEPLEDNFSFEQTVEEYVSGIKEYSSELFLIWEATVLHNLKIFGSDFQDARWPDGMTFSLDTPNKGNVFFVKRTFDFPQALFNDEAFFEENLPKEGSFISSNASVVASPYPNQAFFVNTGAIYSGEGEEKKRSLLTLGFDLNDFLYDVVSTSGHYGCLVSGEKVLIQVSPERANPIPFDAMTTELSHKTTSLSGTVTVADIEYYFMKFQPYKFLDLHFFFFLPKEEEFKFFAATREKVRSIILVSNRQKGVIGILSLLLLWVILSGLSRTITKPIIALSMALRHVKNREWDLIKIPKGRKSKHDEITQLIQSFSDMMEGLKEREKMSGILNKVVSKEIAQEILKGDVQLGGEEKVVTMLFVDIRGFTKLTQNMPPHEVIDLLNTCMTKLSKAIEDNKGVIDKYLGDGIMALYGAPIAFEESPLHAIISGLEMIRMIQEWDLERVQMGLPSLDIGIGIHTGSVCAGNMGALHRLNYTVIGSHVNMASRLCYAAGPGELLISENTYLESCVEENVEVESKGLMTFKGFDEQKKVYKVIKLKEKNRESVLVLKENDEI